MLTSHTLEETFRGYCVMSERATSLTVSKNLNILRLALDEESSLCRHRSAVFHLPPLLAQIMCETIALQNWLLPSESRAVLKIIFYHPEAFTTTIFNWHWWAIHRGRCSVTTQEMSACHSAGKLIPLKSHKITCRNVLCRSVDDMPSSINQQIFMLNACSITTASMKAPLCWPKCSCEWCSGKGQGDLYPTPVGASYHS